MMTGGELQEKALNEIETVLWKVGDGGFSEIFPDFNMDVDLVYGIQREGEDIILETKCFTKDKRRVFVRVKITLEGE